MRKAGWGGELLGVGRGGGCIPANRRQPSHDRTKASSQVGPVIYIPLRSLHSQPCTVGAQCMSGRWTQIKMPSLHQASGVGSASGARL